MTKKSKKKSRKKVATPKIVIRIFKTCIRITIRKN